MSKRKRRSIPFDPTVRVVRGRSGLAPVGDFSDPVLRDLSPLGNLWPQVCRALVYFEVVEEGQDD